MNIHLLRSAELDPHQFTAIHDLIRQYPGPVSYVVHEKPSEYSSDELEMEIWEEERIDKKKMPSRNMNCKMMAEPTITFLRWDSIFDRCDEARRKYRIPDDEPVVLLTDHANEYNWFSGADRNGKLNLFVHTGMWDRFTFPDFRYPVVYLLAAIPLRLQMFDTMEKTVFHFFLKYPDGVAFSALPDHRNELYILYRHYSDTPSVATITARIDDICANKRDCLSQVISRIRKKFEDALPEEMAKQYVIGGGSGRKRRVIIDRGFVEILSRKKASRIFPISS
jgi:hypothetical protein